MIDGVTSDLSCHPRMCVQLGTRTPKPSSTAHWLDVDRAARSRRCSVDYYAYLLISLRTARHRSARNAYYNTNNIKPKNRAERGGLCLWSALACSRGPVRRRVSLTRVY